MTEPVFWGAFGFICYIYFGYPLLLLLWRAISYRPVMKSPVEPTVSLIITAYNERESIEDKILNCRALDYPEDKLELIVSLDAPTDGTDRIVERYQDVRMVRSGVHRGKAAALNNGVALARGEIIVFADVRQTFDSRALRELAANFHDVSVGAVTGELILLDEHGREAKDGMGLYWRYEKWLRRLESGVHSILGTTGAIYAIRRELFRPLPRATVLDDMFIPLRIVMEGKRGVFDPAARAYDHVGTSRWEYGRKVRTLLGNYQLLWQMPQLIFPAHNPVFVQFISHKLGRLFIPYALLMLLVSNLFLLEGFYLVFFVCQVLWYLLACAGILLQRKDPPGPNWLTEVRQ